MHSLGLCSRFDGENDDCQCDRYYAHVNRIGLCSLCVKKCLTTKKNAHEKFAGRERYGNVTVYLYLYLYNQCQSMHGMSMDRYVLPDCRSCLSSAILISTRSVENTNRRAARVGRVCSVEKQHGYSGDTSDCR